MISGLSGIRWINFFTGWLLSIFLVLGQQCEKYGEVHITEPATWICIMGLAVFFMLISAAVWQWLRRLSVKASAGKSIGMTAFAERETAGRHFWKYFMVMVLLYLPVFLGVYPGFFVYDANYELMETVTRRFTTLQPLGHVAAMGLVIQGIYKLTGSYNQGIAVFILLQMGIIAAAEAITLVWLKKRAIPDRVIAFMALLWGIFPVTVMYALCSAKDGLYGAAMLLAFMGCRGMLPEPDSYISSEPQSGRRLEMAAVVAGGGAMMLLRSNGLAAFGAFSIVFIAVKTVELCRQRADSGHKERKKRGAASLAAVAAAFLVYILLNSGLRMALQAEDYGSREMLTVPIQQLARVYSFQREGMTDEQISVLERYIPAQTLKHYTPKCSDLVKVGFDENVYKTNKRDFIRLWLEVGAENPIAYLNGWLMTSYGMLTPAVVIDGYSGNEVFTFTYGDSSYFGYEVEAPGERKPLLPGFDSLYRWLSLEPGVQRLPVINLFFSPGFMLWLLILIIGYFVYHGEYRRTIPYLLPLISWGTCLLGPMSLVRYVWYLWLFVPIGFADIIWGE